VTVLCSTASWAVSLSGFVNAVAPHPVEEPGETNDMQWESCKNSGCDLLQLVVGLYVTQDAKKSRILAVSLRRREKTHRPKIWHLTLLFMPEC
jgi:hypothetical protein